MSSLAIIGASGKLGGATLDALLSYALVPAARLVAITSSHPGSQTWERLSEKGVQVRHGDFEDSASLGSALQGCSKLFLVSSPRIALDFNNSPPGQGREKDHRVAIDEARKTGVKHVYYSSLAFGNPSKAGVMRAHVRTEEYLTSLSDINVTVLREGLYNESWPLYLGYYYPKGDERETIILGGDGQICWTAISDLGLANAMIVADESEKWAGKTLYLSTPPETAKTLKEIAAIVGKARGTTLRVEVVGREEHEEYYVKRAMTKEGEKMGVRGNAAAVEWWASTYDALVDGECLIDDPTLVDLLKQKKRSPVPVEEAIAKMVSA